MQSNSTACSTGQSSNHLHHSGDEVKCSTVCKVLYILPGALPFARCSTVCQVLYLLPGALPFARCSSLCQVQYRLPGALPIARCTTFCQVYYLLAEFLFSNYRNLTRTLLRFSLFFLKLSVTYHRWGNVGHSWRPRLKVVFSMVAIT